MKKFLLIFFILIVLLVGALVAIPYFFKDEIVDALKLEMSKEMDADMDFDKVSISIFKNFPELSLEVKNFSMLSNDATTEVKMGSFFFSMETMSYFKEGTINIKSIVFDEPFIKYVNTDTTQSESEIPETDDVTSKDDDALIVRLNELQIVNGQIYYADSSMQMIADLKGFNLVLRGNFSEVKTDISVKSSMTSIFIQQEGLTMVNALPAELNADLAADLETFSFQFMDNELRLGPVNLKLDGKVAEAENGWDIDLSFDAPGMNMKKLLTMVPEAYASSIADLNTDGDIALNGSVKGTYVDLEQLPMFTINFRVENGYFQYPDLPKSVKNIQVAAAITHPNAQNMDATMVVVDQFECMIGENPLQSKWTFKTPVSDLNIDGFLKGELNLASLKDVFPMEDAELAGKIVADVKLKGNMSAIEKELYDKFYAAGFLQLSGFKYKSDDLPQGLLIQNASMDFTPARINLKNFKGSMGRSDLSLSGYLTNYISYTFQNGTLKGNLNHFSNVIDANEFLDSEDNETNEVTSDSIESELMLIPDKLELTFTSKINNLYYDNLKINNTNGKISVKERIVSLDQLKMQLLSGSMIMTGQYNSKDTLKVFSDMKVKVNQIDVAQGVAAFSSIQKIAPISRYAEGKVSLDISYFAPFDNKGEILMDKLESKGFLSSQELRISNNSALDQLAKVTNNPKYKDLSTNSFKANYIIKDGKVIVLPFKVKVDDKDMEIWGNHTLNNVMDYNIKTTVAPKELGDQVGNLLTLVADPNKQLPITVKIKGDVKKPKISVDTKEALKELQKNAGGILKGLF